MFNTLLNFMKDSRVNTKSNFDQKCANNNSKFYFKQLIFYFNQKVAKLMGKMLLMK